MHTHPCFPCPPLPPQPLPSHSNLFNCLLTVLEKLMTGPALSSATPNSLWVSLK